MKRLNLLSFLPLLLLLTQCKKERLQSYNEKPAVYFEDFTGSDSLVRSLAGVAGDSDTVLVAVKLLGDASATDRQFSVEVDDTYSDAVAGQHYETLKTSYVLPAHQFSVDIPIVLYKTDPELESRSFKLGLKLVETGELGVGYSNRAEAHILFTSQLIEPSYWDSFLKNYYGDYSKVKHQKCIEIQGFDFPATREEIDKVFMARLMSYGRVVCKYFIDNTVYDENGNKILPWSPL